MCTLECQTLLLINEREINIINDTMFTDAVIKIATV